MLVGSSSNKAPSYLILFSVVQQYKYANIIKGTLGTRTLLANFKNEKVAL